MLKKFGIISASLIGIIILWLVFANSIIHSMFNVSYAREASFEEEFSDALSSPYITQYNIDVFMANNDLLESVSGIGWAFVEAAEENPDRYVSYVLKNDHKCYELRTEIPEYGNYRNRVELAAMFGLKYSNVGFIYDISTYNVDNGAYEFYLYCWENESTYSMINTGKQLVKNGADIRLEDYRSSPADISNYSKGEAPYHIYIDSVSLENDLLNIDGWVFIDDMDTADQQVFVKIGDSAYTTVQVSRSGVSEAFGNELYRDSGFSASINAEQLPEANTDFTILVENGGMLYECSTVSESVPEESVPAITEDISGFFSSDTAPVYCTDIFSIENGMLHIAGWAFAEGLDCAEQTVYIIVGGNTYIAGVVTREDVAEAFGNQLYMESGFDFLIPAETIPEGEETITISVENGGVLYSVDIEVMHQGDTIST